jgi:hypothetical protein
VLRRRNTGGFAVAGLGYLTSSIDERRAQPMKAVESGTARCPRCMALTGYQFFDHGATLLYEVRCSSCSNVYTEVTELPSASAA